jgi:hypothetical protein
MIRSAAAVVLALTLSPALVHAQDAVLTVTVASADVHTGPSTATPVIGHVSRDTVLPVSRNLGSWVRVIWPAAPDGAGYVHVTMGRLRGIKTDALAASTSPRQSSSSSPERASSAPAPEPNAPASMTPRAHTATEERVAVRGPEGETPISHIIGVGGLLGSVGSVGSMTSFGATARAWRNDRLGIQFRLTRDSMTSAVAPGRVTAMQFEPGVVYALFDHVSDYVWIRPYVGSGLSVHHQTLKVQAPAATESITSNGFGYRVFGGTELTFASVTRFGLSAELGYRRLPTPFPGFDADRLSVSIAGHWYIK